MMKRLLILVLGLVMGVSSCGGDEAMELTTELVVDNNVSDSEVNEIEAGVAEKEGVMDVDDDMVWQIDNYTTHLIGSEIAANSDGLSTANPNQWFYSKLDIKGGFSSVAGPVEGWQEFVLWKMKDGDDLVGRMVVGCGPVCEYSFNFYKGKGATIEEYDREKLFPIEEMKEHMLERLPIVIAENELEYTDDYQMLYILPQKGTGMQVDLLVGADEMQVPLLHLSWDKTKFSIEELYEKNTNTID